MDYNTATFLTERLYYLYKPRNNKLSELSRLLLAKVYFLNGKPNMVYMLLKAHEDAKLPQTKFILAQACFQMGKYSEAESCLLGKDRKQSSSFKSGFDRLPLKAQGFYLLGRICRRTSRINKAIECFRHCLALNSLHWGAYQALCDLGADVDEKTWFRTEAIPLQSPTFVRYASTYHAHTHSSHNRSNNHDHDSHPDPLTKANPDNFLAVAGLEDTISKAFANIEATGSVRAVEGVGEHSNTASLEHNALDTKKQFGAPTKTPKGFRTPNPSVSASDRYLLKTPITPAYATPPSFSTNTIKNTTNHHAQPKPTATPTPNPRYKSSSSFAKPRTRKGNSSMGHHPPAPERPLRRSARISSSQDSTIAGSGSGTGSTNSDKTAGQKTPRRRSGRNDSRTKKPRKNHHSNSRSSKDINSTLDFQPTSGANTPQPYSQHHPQSAAVTPTPTPHSRHHAPVKRKLQGGGNLRHALNSKASGKQPAVADRSKHKSRGEFGSVPFALDVKTPGDGGGNGLDAKLPDRYQASDSADEHGRGGAVSAGGGGFGTYSLMIEERARLQSILCTMGVGYKLLSRFQCKEAVEEFEKLPINHFNSGWVLCMVGQCYFEMVNYPKCVDTFRVARKIEPYRSEGLEYFSTSLWHMKKEVELSYLAQTTTEFDKHSPLSWIVVGNCLSLQKEHDTALKFFRRAIQLDPRSAWGYTLSAHEFVANEDFEKALSGFRQAIGVNPRHYNAWYGMGNIYFRQEKYGLAAYHFRRALAINPRNTVLYCYLGMVLHANEQYEEALEMLSQAENLEPTNSLAKYQKANVFFSLHRYQDALDVLQHVRDFAPREASVHFLMGKVCKKLGKVNQAIIHFTTTLDLNPKDKNVVKSAIDKLHCGDTDSQSDDGF